MRNIYTQIIKWFGLISFVISILLLVVKFMDIKIPYIPNFSFSWLLFFIFTSGIIAFLFYQLESNKRFSHIYFIKPFFETSKNKYISFFLLLWILLLPIAFLIHFFTPEKIEIYTYFGYFGTWLTFLGLLITQRIYFEIKYKTNHNFEEFVNTLEDFIRVSVKDDEIYLILPTLFIGAVGYPKFNANFRKKIEKLASDKTKKLSIALFDYDEEEVKEIIKYKNENKIHFGNSNNKINEENETLFLQKILSSKSPLVQFHRKWNKFDDSSKKGEFYFDLLSFMDKLTEIEKLVGDKFKIEKIKKEYFDFEDNDTSNGDKGLFLFANTSQNIYYLGTIRIYAQEKINFQNTIIEELEINKEFETIFNTFVKDRC